MDRVDTGFDTLIWTLKWGLKQLLRAAESAIWNLEAQNPVANITGFSEGAKALWQNFVV